MIERSRASIRPLQGAQAATSACRSAGAKCRQMHVVQTDCVVHERRFFQYPGLRCWCATATTIIRHHELNKLPHMEIFQQESAGTRARCLPRIWILSDARYCQVHFFSNPLPQSRHLGVLIDDCIRKFVACRKLKTKFHFLFIEISKIHVSY